MSIICHPSSAFNFDLTSPVHLVQRGQGPPKTFPLLPEEMQVQSSQERSPKSHSETISMVGGFPMFLCSGTLGEPGQVQTRLLLRFPSPAQDSRAFCSGSGLRQGVLKPVQRGSLLSLCLDSDKGIFKLLEIKVAASQGYFHPKINQGCPWSQAQGGWCSQTEPEGSTAREG